MKKFIFLTLILFGSFAQGYTCKFISEEKTKGLGKICYYDCILEGKRAVNIEYGLCPIVVDSEELPKFSN